MPLLIINALFSSFFLVRVVKGRWTRHPHYLAVALIGSVAGLLVLRAVSSGSEDGLIAGNLGALAGAWVAILVFDMAMGEA